MTSGVRKRLIAFLVVSVVGIVYISATLLGLVDRVLGKGYSVTAELTATGGLYEGSLVTYRGVQIGKVASMSPRPDGVNVKLALEDEARVPVDSPVFVHNGSAVGEQYLDFEPKDDSGPFLKEGSVITGGLDTLPVDEADLLVDLDQFVRSVNRPDLKSVITELGQLFYNTGRPLQDLIDGGSAFLNEAERNKQQTIRLLENGRTVLRTQQANAGNIRAFADGLQQVTRTLRTEDNDIRTILQGGPGTTGQIQALLEGLEPTLPLLLSNIVTVNQVTSIRLPAIEQLLVTYPVLIASGFSGTTRDGYGHVHLDYTREPGPCRKGYLPVERWRSPDDLSDGKVYLKARCAEPLPSAARGANYVPRPNNGSARVAPYDPATGEVMGGPERYFVSNGSAGIDIYGKDAWKWMLVGPTVE